MANLTAEQIDEVVGDLMRRYSSIWREIPVTKPQFRAWVANNVEPELEAAEIAVFQATPAGSAKDWLQANSDIGRDIMIQIEQKRLEVL